jgi:hypothetical protein
MWNMRQLTLLRIEIQTSSLISDPTEALYHAFSANAEEAAQYENMF